MVKSLELKSKDKVNLYAIGDFHIGNIGFEEEKVKRIVEIIRKDKYAKVILMGDYGEFINPKDKRFDMDSLSPKYNTIEKQYVGIRNLLTPIKNKIIGLLMGNHDYTIKSSMGMDIPRLLSNDLGVTYLGNVGIINYTVGKKPFTLLSLHGGGMATTIGGQVNKIKKYSENLERKPDICLIGHYHRIDVIMDPKLGNDFSTKLKYLAITGSFFNTYKSLEDNYANRQFYSPLPVGCVMFELNSNGDIKDNKIIL
jgi:predicted phosphodiesterase